MKQGLSAPYRDAAEEFTRRVRSALNERVNAIVL